MDEGPVSARASRPSWKLRPPIDGDVQGLVVSGFGSLETGRALFLEFGWPDAEAGATALRALLAAAPITDAVPPPADPAKSSERAAAIAFTWTGLRKLGLDAAALASFSRPFREGMFQTDRLRRLGDRRRDEWLPTVIPGGPLWSGNTAGRRDAAPAEPVEAYDVPHAESGDPRPRTALTVHALLCLYTASEKDADDWTRAIEEALAPHQVKLVHRLPLVLDVEGHGISREHFGFADGLSQPAPHDEGGAVTIGGAPARPDSVQGVPLGELLIGYANGHHEAAPGPVVRDPRGEAAGLPRFAKAEGFFDLGLNGSYLVVRQLKQDVAAFWKSMDANAARIREQDPDHAEHVSADWLAERVIGRGREGHLLCTPPDKYLPPGEDGLPDSGYLFHERDPHGTGCPPGSHVRRANPRDGLAPKPEMRQTLLDAANNHRIFRRGRKYGPKIGDERRDDGVDRGLLFMCLNTDIARQFEFVQQTWLLNANFATLFEEYDPLVGAPGRLTIKEEPLRRIVDVETFVQMVGGDYFFLPSLPALRYLASL